MFRTAVSGVRIQVSRYYILTKLVDEYHPLITRILGKQIVLGISHTPLVILGD
jgi:hypothetical protein